MARKANRETTEDGWLQIMEQFKAGKSDRELGRAWDVSPATVAAQRHARGVMREDYPRLATVRPSRSTRRLSGSTGDGGDGPVLDLPEGDDPVAAADALLAYSLELARAGRWDESITVARLSRSRLLTLVTREQVLGRAGGAEPGPATEPLPCPPVLRAAQRAPDGDWRTWLFLGGRGAGKTLAGAAWLAGRARACGRLAIAAPTLLDAREVMIEGPSGLRGLGAAFGPEGGLPTYSASRRRLTWPNGAVGLVFSAEDPDSFRGPQFAAAWADELCAWARPTALEQLRLGLRLGEDPRLVVTTTPRPTGALRTLLGEAGLVQTRGTAAENAGHLAPGFLEGLRALYGGTRLARQELEGEVLEAPEGGLFRREDLDGARALGAEPRPERFDELVVGVDPPAGAVEGGAACGVVVAGRLGERAWVLEDRTAHGLSPLGWAGRVRVAAQDAGALGPVRVVAEANQGGDMVAAVLAQAGVGRVSLVRASVGKRARAEPVALLYEQGRVAHAGGLVALEDQLLLLGTAEGAAAGPSPDRADAAVWALTALMLEPRWERPRITAL